MTFLLNCILCIGISCFGFFVIYTGLYKDAISKNQPITKLDLRFVSLVIWTVIIGVMLISYISGVRSAKPIVKEEARSYQENKENCKPYTYVKEINMCIDNNFIKEVK